jgi:murein DD-endopeptidase MepM/ murein hydrolase activator NlpD
MMKRSYTLIFVPHTGERHTKWRLSCRALKALAVLAGVAVLSAGALTVHYYSFFQELTELRELRLGNSELKRQNLDYEVSVEHLNEQVALLEDFVMKLSVMAGLGDGAEMAERGVGGPLDLEVGGAPSSAYGQVKDELDRMRGELTDLEEQTRTLEHFYAENTAMLASTPSIFPVRGYFSSTYGTRKDPFTGDRAMHYGIDISTPMGRSVVATADGIILYAARRGTYGNIVVIDHKFDMMTRYAHLSKFAVKAGALVKRGDVIGYVGNTGRSRAPHLHYEVWVDDRTVHPLDYILEYYRSFDPRNRPIASATAP